MKRYCYAIEYAYGAHVINRGGVADKIYRFPTRQGRDHWVAMGSPYYTSPGFREAVAAADRRVRAVKRWAERYNGMYPMAVPAPA